MLRALSRGGFKGIEGRGALGVEALPSHLNFTWRHPEDYNKLLLQ